MEVSSQMPLAEGLISRNPSVTPPVALYMTVLLHSMLAKHNSGKKEKSVPLFQGDATVTHTFHLYS